jgi:hypothetical protein
MLQRFLNSFKTDCRYIVRDPVLMAAALYPLIVILLLRLAINPVSDLIFLKTGFRLEIYYTIIAITLISVIPLLVGFIYAVTDIDKTVSNKDNSLSLTPADKKSFLFFRLMEPALFSFIMILIVTLFTDPVPSEGWLRSVFISLLLSVQSSLVLLFIRSFAGSRIKAIVLLKIYGILLVVVPLGLLLHHPWNYLLFCFPYYWLSWAWVTYSPSESLFYGAISIAISFGCIVWFYTHLLKENKVRI